MNSLVTGLPTTLAWLALTAVALGACGDDDRPDAGSSIDSGALLPDGGSREAGAGMDASPGTMDAEAGTLPRGDGAVSPGTDGSAGDAGVTTDATVADSGPADAGPPDAGPACDPSAAPALPALKLEPVAGVGMLSSLVFAAQPPGSTDWYLVQQSGQIRVLSGGVLTPTSFLDLSVSSVVGGETGLLGLAFPSDYATSGKFYVMLTPSVGGDANTDYVLEYTRSAADPLVADVASRKVIVQLPASAANHNGGNVLFGTDGLLYVGTGDGGGGCNSDQPGGPQDVNSLFGKILRLDPRAPPSYAAAGNPFVGGGDARVYHYGLRNPFRFGFDRATGDLYIGDVGQDRYEEVDFASAGTAGLNFGWPKFEGDHVDTCGTDKALRPGSSATKPIVDIPRAAGASPPFGDYVSVIGGRVYRGTALPSLRGVFLFGDYQGIRLGALRQCGQTTSPVTPILKNKDVNSPSTLYLASTAGQPALGQLTAIVEDNAGELYLLANSNTLLKLVPGP
jgi:glucose/arabinose dehydrogenase